MKLMLRCSRCLHKAETDEKTFRAFVTPSIWERLKQQKDIVLATFVFNTACPNCRPGKGKSLGGKIFVVRNKL